MVKSEITCASNSESSCENLTGNRPTFLLPELPFLCIVIYILGGKAIAEIADAGQFQSIGRFGSIKP